jgi:hypothetical protein
MSSVVLATAGYDHTIRFWEATSGICYRTLQYADSQVNKLEITAEKQYVAAAGNSQVRLFEVNSNDPQPVMSYDGHAGNVTAVGFQKDSKWMYTGEGGAAGVGGGGGRGAAGVERITRRPGVGARRVTWLEEEPGAAAGRQRGRRRRLAACPHPAPPPPNPSLPLPPPPPRRRGRHRARVGPAHARLPARVRKPRGGEHRGAAPQPGGADLGCGAAARAGGGCSARGAVARVRRARPPPQPPAAAAPLSAPQPPAVSQTSRPRTPPHPSPAPPGDQTGHIRVWDLTANACSCELVPEVGTAVRSLTVALDGSMIVAGNNHGTCYVWRMLRGTTLTTHFEPLHKLRAHSSYVLKCLISPDVQQLATTSSDKTVKLWNLDGFGLDRTLTGHTRWVWDAVFSVDAAYLVTASSDATARLWDLSSGGWRGWGDGEGAATGQAGKLRGQSGCSKAAARAAAAAALRTGRRGASRARDPTCRCRVLTRRPRPRPHRLRARAGEAIRTYSGHHKAIVCCALNDSAIDGRDGDG